MSNGIRLALDEMPLVMIAETCMAAEPFVHQNRVLGHHVLLCIVSGGMDVIEEGVRFELGPGDLLLMKAGAHHWGGRPCLPGTRWLFVHFMPSRVCARRAPAAFVRNQEFCAEDYAREVELPKRARAEAGGAVYENLMRMARMFASDDPLRAPRMSALLMEILLELHAQANARPSAIDDPVAAAVALLGRRTGVSLDSAALARECGLSYKYLAALFKERTGLSPQAYHTRIRMSEAARLLRESGLSVSEISDRQGFCNPQYFSRVFASVYGMPPREYRRGFIRAQP